MWLRTLILFDHSGKSEQRLLHLAACWLGSTNRRTGTEVSLLKCQQPGKMFLAPKYWIQPTED